MLLDLGQKLNMIFLDLNITQCGHQVITELSSYGLFWKLSKIISVSIDISSKCTYIHVMYDNAVWS